MLKSCETHAGRHDPTLERDFVCSTYRTLVSIKHSLLQGRGRGGRGEYTWRGRSTSRRGRYHSSAMCVIPRRQRSSAFKSTTYKRRARLEKDQNEPTALNVEGANANILKSFRGRGKAGGTKRTAIWLPPSSHLMRADGTTRPRCP